MILCHTRCSALSQVVAGILLLLFSNGSSIHACFGGGVKEVGNDTGMLNPSNKEIWNGWDAPPGAKEAWEEWLAEQKNEQSGKMGKLTDEEKAAGVLPAGHGVRGWPSDWIDLQPGFSGMKPPPWAYVPRNYGKPTRCYRQPDLGSCTQKLTRYGYNPFADECQQFTYSGCGGNDNNFLKQLDCERECINPAMGCDPDSGLPQDEDPDLFS